MKPVFYKLIVCGVCALASGSIAKAQDTTTTGQSTYAQLSALTSQIAILKAQAQVAQLQQQIDQIKHAAGDGTNAQAPTVALPYGRGAVPVVTPPLGGGLPQVVSISGTGQRLTALVALPDGGEIEVAPGTSIGGGAVVQSISPNAVRVIQSGQLLALPFAGGGMNASVYTPGG